MSGLRLDFVIRSLERGGAERQVATLAPALAARGHDVVVRPLRARVPGDLTAELEAAGVPVVPGIAGPGWSLRGTARLSRALRARRPDVVYALLPHANLAALLARRVAGNTPVVVGVRSVQPTRPDRRWSRSLYPVEARLARAATAVVANSGPAADWARRRGFLGDRIVVIPNAIDTERWDRDRAAGAAVRRDWGLPDGALLVGRVGALRPVKDHDTFLAAAALAAAEDPSLHFAVVGDGPERPHIEARARAGDLAGRCIVAGARTDMVAVMSAFDVHVSSSRAESFPNVLLEALACGAPCVATDAGDSALVVGQDAVVPVGDPAALAGAVVGLSGRLRADEAGLRAGARARVLGRFDLDTVTTALESVLVEAAASG